MNFIDFKNALADFSIFSLSDIRAVEDRFDRRRLSEWQKKGYIRKIIKGHYLFSDVKIDEEKLFQIANKIYRPSYISFETALSYYHLIPESVYAITSASSKRTYEFQASMSRFLYRRINPKLFFGYVLISDRIRIASLEKTVLDYFYLNTSIRTEDDFASIRIDRDTFLEQLNERNMFSYLQQFRQKKLTERIKYFMEWIKNA